MDSMDHSDAVVNDHYEALYRFALSLTRAESDAADLTQQTFYVWATRGHQLRDRSKVRTWLHTTLHRAFLQSRRRQQRFSDAEADGWIEQLPDGSPLPADRLDRLQVLPALAQLDEKFQAAVALFYLEDCPYKEIAVILDVPVGTVKSRIARGIAQLRGIVCRDNPRTSRPPMPEAERLRRRAPVLGRRKVQPPVVHGYSGT